MALTDDRGKASCVADGVWMLETPFTGVPLMLYVIDGGSELALVDSGIASTPDDFVFPFFEKLGRRPDLLVNTHAHVDHFGGNARLKAAWPDLEIAAHHVDARWIEDTQRHLAEFYRQMPDDWFFDDGGAGLLELCGGNTPVDRRLEDDGMLNVGERSFRVLRSEGHSPGHVTLFEETTGIAITGDAALGWGPPTAEGTPDAPSVYYDADAYLAGVHMAADLKARTYCTGHFGTIDHAGMSKISTESEEFVESFDKWTLDALSDGKPHTLHEIALHLSRQIPTYEFGFHIHASAQANLERHARKDRVRTRVIDGRRHFQRPDGT